MTYNERMTYTHGRIPDSFFYHQPTLELAPALLGMELVHKTPEGETAGIIVEVEAYMGIEDKGAHTYGGKRTGRTEAMFGPPGHAYIYFIYGMYYCLNVVSGPPGEPQAILIRALQPTLGIPLMATRRGVRLDFAEEQIFSISHPKVKTLTNGPGKLCQALAITREQYGLDLRTSPLYLCHFHDPIPQEHIATGPRINIDYAEEAQDYPWRFWIRGNPFVSKRG